jgi:hypothetical protein
MLSYIQNNFLLCVLTEYVGCMRVVTTPLLSVMLKLGGEGRGEERRGAVGEGMRDADLQVVVEHYAL